MPTTYTPDYAEALKQRAGLLEALKEAVELLKRSYERTTSVSLGEVEPAIKRAEQAIAQAQEGKPNENV